MRAVLITLAAVCFSFQSCKRQGAGTHWSAGESLKILEGRYQALAGPTWPGNATRESGYTSYRISVEEASGGTWRTLFEESMPIEGLPQEFRERHAPEVATFDHATSTVLFDLGSQQFQFKIDAEAVGGNGGQAR